jgi:hypothetical protein
MREIHAVRASMNSPERGKVGRDVLIASFSPTRSRLLGNTLGDTSDGPMGHHALELFGSIPFEATDGHTQIPLEQGLFLLDVSISLKQGRAHSCISIRVHPCSAPRPAWRLPPIPTIIVSLWWLIISWLRCGQSVPVDPDERRMGVDKAKNSFGCSRLVFHERVPGTARERGDLARQHSLARLLDCTESLSCNPGNRPFGNLVTVERVTRERVADFLVERRIGRANEYFFLQRCRTA